MARVFPEAEITHAAFRRRLSLEERKLHIGDRFSSDRDEPEQDARDFEKTDPRRGVRAGEGDGQRQQPDQQSLELKESKKHQPGAFGKLLPEIGVAWILLRVVGHHAFVEMHAETEAPRADHRRDEAIANHVSAAKDSIKKRHWSEAERPPDINDPRVIHPPREKPYDHHHRHGESGSSDYERQRIHAARSMPRPRRHGIQFPQCQRNRIRLGRLARQNFLDSAVKLPRGGEDFLKVGQILGSGLGTLGEDFGITNNGVERGEEIVAQTRG